MLAQIGARLVAVVVPACLLLACSQDAGPGQSADLQGPTPRPTSCAVSGACTLREAAEAAGILVGVTDDLGDERAERLIAREFNALTAGGGLLWTVVHPNPDEWSFEAADRTVAFAEEHGLTLTVTHFVWDQAVDISTTPEWVKEIDDPDSLKQAMLDHLMAITDRYGDRIYRWIVVNEPFEYVGSALYRNHFFEVLGPDYVGEAFRIASQAAPDAELWLNEILTENNPAKSAALIELAADLVSKGVPIDGVGLQGHLFAGDPDLALVEDTMRRIGDLGLRVAVTELDAPVPQDEPDRLDVQAARLAGMIQACLAVPACDSVTFWGLHDGMSWLNWYLDPGLDPLLFNETLRPKPAYSAVLDALAAGRPGR